MNTQKGFSKILLVFVGLAVIVTTAYYFLPQKHENVMNDDIVQNSVYRNSIHNFEIKNPEAWNIDESGKLGTIVVFMNPNSDKENEQAFNSNINILSRNLQSLGVKNMEEYVNLNKKMLEKSKENLKFVSDDSILIDNKYDGRIIGITFMQNGLTLKDKHLLVIKDGIVYVITGTILESKWLDNERIINQSLNSFSFK